MVFLAIGRLCFLALTDAAMIPALYVMKRNHRHFELFIGVFHLVIAFCFNVAEALHQTLFLRELQWHFISDVLSITYFLLLCVHLMGFRDEDRNILLRYIAFALAWLLKTKDGWDSTLYEACLIIAYIGGVVYRRTMAPSKSIAPLQSEPAKYALLLLAGAAVAGVLLVFVTEESSGVVGALLKACMHVLGGAAFYYAWLCVPCLDTKKHDDFMPTHSSYI